MITRRAPRAVAAAVALAGVGVVGPATPGAATARSNASIDRVVTLGDSYASGLGIHRDASDYDDHGPPAHSFASTTRLGGSTCHRELDSTPGPRLAAARGADSVFVACAGAELDEIANQIAAADLAGTGTGTLVMLTIGGNDLRTHGGDRWPDVLVDCIVSTRCDRDDDHRIANLDGIEEELGDLLAALVAELPDAVVRVIGYPHLMQPGRWTCAGVTGVGRAEANWIDARVDELNGAVHAATATVRRTSGADVRFVPVDDEFDGHGACRMWQRDRHVNDSLLGETYVRRMQPDGTIEDRWNDSLLGVSGASFHPSQAGYDAIGRAIADTL